MKYICQIADGYMLAESDVHQLIVVKTGYPYPDTDKSNFGMLKDLFEKELGVCKSEDWYRDKYFLLKEYVMQFIDRDYAIDINNLYKVLNGEKLDINRVEHLKGSIISTDEAKIYDFNFKFGFVQAYLICNLGRIPDNEYFKVKFPKLYSKMPMDGTFLIFEISAESHFSVTSQRYRDIFDYVEQADEQIESEVSSICERYTGVNFKVLISMIAFSGASDCTRNCYQLDRSSFLSILDSIKNHNTIKFSDNSFADCYSHALSDYIAETKGYDILDICKNVNTFSSAALTRDVQKDIVSKLNSISISSITVTNKNLFLKYIEIAAKNSNNVPIDYSDDDTREVLEDSYDGLIYALVERAKKQCSFHNGNDCYFEINAPKIAKFYKEKENVRLAIDEVMVGFKPDTGMDDILRYHLNKVFTPKYANVLGLLIQNKLSMARQTSMQFVVDSIYESEVPILLGFLFSDMERRIIFDIEGLKFTESAIRDRFLNRNSKVSRGLNVSGHITGRFNVLAELFLNFGNHFFIRSVHWGLGDYDYHMSYTLCFKDGFISNDYFVTTSISDETFEGLKLACKLDFIVRMVVTMKCLTKGVSFIDIDDVGVKFNSSTQEVNLWYSIKEEKV